MVETLGLGSLGKTTTRFKSSDMSLEDIKYFTSEDFCHCPVVACVNHQSDDFIEIHDTEKQHALKGDTGFLELSEMFTPREWDEFVKHARDPKLTELSIEMLENKINKKFNDKLHERKDKLQINFMRGFITTKDLKKTYVYTFRPSQ